MVTDHDEVAGRTSTPEQSLATPAQGGDSLLATFADLVADLALDLARGTLNPALQKMHDDWRSEATQFRRDTAEWVSRVNINRQHMEQAVERQHNLSQEVYNTHAKLLQEMAAFQKERRDNREWQEQVSATLNRLSELHRELSVESTRIAGVVRDIISELARFQADAGKRSELFEENLTAKLAEQTESIQSQLQSSSEVVDEALEALSKTNEETRSVLARDLTALRREVQEVATRMSRDITENRAASQQSSDQRFNRMEKITRSSGYKVLGFLLFGELVIMGGLGYLIMQLIK